jgi:hypothetical protein
MVAKDKTRPMEKLFKGFPQSFIREISYVEWKLLGIIFSVIALITAGFHLYLYRSNNEIGVAARQTERTTSVRVLKTANNAWWKISALPCLDGFS